MFKDKKALEQVLYALSEQLEEAGANPVEMIICGGAALNVLGFVQRTTHDVDIVAFIDKNKNGKTRITKADPLKPELKEAAVKVQKDFNLQENWLNSDPASIMDFGLPDGRMDRVETRSYGKKLIIHFLGKYDQIHFKLYAAVDQGGKHFDDLMALKPTEKELEKAARWSITHDVSDVYKAILISFLEQTGHKDVAERL